MSPVPGPALELALALFQAPARLTAARNRPLPEGTDQLLRLLGAPLPEREAIAAKLQVAPVYLHEACVFFVTEVLLAPQADSYRVLGLRPDCTQAHIKEHYRLLMRCLHPDRDSNDWHSVHAPQINGACGNLSTPVVRAAYDATRRPVVPVSSEVPSVAWRASDPVDEPLRGHNPRVWIAHLPALVIASGIVLLAVLSLALWQTRLPGATDPDAHPFRSASASAGAGPAPVASMVAGSTESARELAIATTVLVPADVTTAGDDERLRTVMAPQPVDPVVRARAADERPPPGGDLARISHTPPAAAADTLAVARRAPSIRLNVPLSTSSPSLSPRGAPQRRLGALAKEWCEKCGLVTDSDGSPTRTDGPVVAVPVLVPKGSSPLSPRADTDMPAPPGADIAPAADADRDADISVPAASSATVPDASAGRGRAAALLVVFVDRYAAGDLPGLLSLFSEDARIERGGLASIAEDYGKLFQDSAGRHLALSNIQWQRQRDGWVAEGRFVASVASHQSARVRQVAGSIRFSIRDGDRGLRIMRLEHQIDP